MYDYGKSVKSSDSDELINTYLLRPMAGLIVRALYSTPITPNQVTIVSTIAGIVAAGFYGAGTSATVALGGMFVTLKDLLDSADGQLARARQQYSRIGRFLDSIGDFVVNLAVFSAIGCMLTMKTGEMTFAILAFLGFWGITFRVSYHVFYQASFLHLSNDYANNRVTEEIQATDLSGDRQALRLQYVFQSLYGWQDLLVLKMDAWCRRGRDSREFGAGWYSDRLGLRLSGLIGMGTELFLLTLCSLYNKLEWYLVLNIVVMNGVLLANIAYRRWSLFHGVTRRMGRLGL
jgi:phosphatidylglycerophosphate synthase